MIGEFNGKEKEEAEIKQKSSIFSRKNIRDMMYGFLVIFLLLLVFMVGQMQTLAMVDYVNKVCPGGTVLSASPLYGLVIAPKGYNQTNYSKYGNGNWTNLTIENYTQSNLTPNLSNITYVPV